MQTNISNVRLGQIAWLLLTLLLLSILYSTCEDNKTQLANVNALNGELTSYKLKNGQLVVSTAALVYTNRQLRENVLDKDTELKEMTKKYSMIRTVTKYVTKIKVDTINVIYKDSIPCVFEKKGSLATKDYSLNYKSTQKGVAISDLSIENQVSILTGTKRKWFLGKETLTVSVTNTNPLIKTENLQHIEVKGKKKFWDTTVFKIGLGLVAGVYIAK